MVPDQGRAPRIVRRVPELVALASVPWSYFGEGLSVADSLGSAVLWWILAYVALMLFAVFLHMVGIR